MRVSEPDLRNVPFDEIEGFFENLRKKSPKGQIFLMYMDARDDTHG